MSEDNFDDLIKGKLSEFSPVADENAWTAFESARDLDIQNEANLNDELQFDELIKTQISSYSVPYQTDHWGILQDHLKTIEERKHTVYISKFLESVAIFLILLTFIHLSGLSDTFDYDSKDYTSQNLYANSSQSTGSQNLPSAKAPSVNEVVNKNTSINSQITIAESSLYGPAAMNIVMQDYQSEISHSSEILNIDVSQTILNLQKKELIELASAIENHSDNTAHSELVTMPFATFEKPESEYALSFPLKFEPTNKKPVYSLSIYGAGDINLINTPFDKLYSIASYNREALNNSYGINISRKMNKMEMESGIGYANRVYQPAIIREAFGLFADHYFEKSLKKISYDIVNVPINFKYHIIDQTGWSAYVMAGAALNLVMNANYDINETLLQGRPSPDRYTPEEARLDEKPFIRGILNDGNFKDHYFASVGFGFGIEKKIFNNTSIYIQPSYQRHILSGDIGIGPNKDKIHTSSLQFGVKTVLN